MPEEAGLTFRFSTWNVGGCDTTFLFSPEGNKLVGGPSALVAFQEVGRAKPGWHVRSTDKTRLLSCRQDEAWRGTGIGYNSDVWTVMRKKATKAGTWFRLRHLTTLQELWIGSIYISPSAPMIEHQGLLRDRDHLESLPASTVPVYLGGDCNAAAKWNRDIPLGESGKTKMMVDLLREFGFRPTTERTRRSSH